MNILTTILRADQNIIRQQIADKTPSQKGDLKARKKLLSQGIDVELINECLK